MDLSACDGPDRAHLRRVDHPDHVWKILHGLGFSAQKPEARARGRNDRAIERWWKWEWPRIKKKARRLNATIAFLDESGFMLQPLVRRSWAPHGQTPILRCWNRRDRLSAIGGILVPPSRKRHRPSATSRMHAKNIQAPQATEFLRAVDRHVHGPKIIVQDRLNVHKAAIKHSLTGRSADAPRVMVEWLSLLRPGAQPRRAALEQRKARGSRQPRARRPRRSWPPCPRLAHAPALPITPVRLRLRSRGPFSMKEPASICAEFSNAQPSRSSARRWSPCP